MAVLLTLLTACTGIPEGITPITGFKPERYLGKWYEIARLDHSFERGLRQVSAEYATREDGGIEVLNGGRDRDGEWQEARGKAYFVADEGTGHLKVSFFGPFYGSYVIFELDQENYQYAFVAGYNKSYLWLLSRTPTISEDLRAHFIRRAEELGFNTSELIFVDQEPNPGD
jgi:apolipoprotein D and lipocalin family protein